MEKTFLDKLIEKELGRDLHYGESLEAQVMWENTGKAFATLFAKQFATYTTSNIKDGTKNQRLVSLVDDLNRECIRRGHKIDELEAQVAELQEKLNKIQSAFI